MPLQNLCINPVTVRVATWTNVRGNREPTYADTLSHASVQPMKASRIQLHGLEAGDTGYTCYFASDPGVNTADIIAWGSKTLSVLGPTRDEAGRGVCFAVDAKEVK